MDEAKLHHEISRDEGVMHTVYLDHLSLKTCGIGHLCIEGKDPEFDQPVGTPVSKERVAELFQDDMRSVLLDCERLYSNFYDLPEDAQHVVANMMFNLGLPRLRKFKNMKKAVDAGDYQQAALEMCDSKWYSQVKNRADRLVKRMRSIG